MNIANCRISVITVTYNAAKDLPGLIDSLRSQIDKNFEWIVVDGASTDSTLEFLKDAGDILTKVVSEPDFGIYDAMNKAIQMATGEYYLVVGADDRLYPQTINRLNLILNSNDKFFDVLIANIETENGILKYRKRKILGQIYFHSVASLIRRSLHQDFGLYCRRFPIAADQFFLSMVARDRPNRVHGVDIISGYHSTKGVSHVDAVGALTEIYRVRIDIEGYPFRETILLFFRLLRLQLKYYFYYTKPKNR